MPDGAPAEEFLSAVSALRAAHPEAPSRYALPLAFNTFGDDEIAAALEVLVTGPLTLSRRVEEFERRFAAAHGAPDAVYVNSGSSANLLMLATLMRGVDGSAPALAPGDEVIVPAVTWSTTIWPIAQMGAVPVLVDVSTETLNLTLESVEAAITPRTKAIFVTHLLGNVGPIEQIRVLAADRGLLLFEDCCEALDAEVDGKKVGTFGRMGSYSFYFSHHICTIEGGMVVANDAVDSETLRTLRAHGWSRNLSPDRRAAVEAAYPDIDPRFLFVDAGYNLRPTELQAAIGMVQMDRREAFLAVRRRLGAEWAAARDAYPALFETTVFALGASHFAFPIVLRDNAPATRVDLMAFMEQRGIETRPLVAGNLARQPGMQVVRHRVSGALPGADALHTRAMYVGIPVTDNAPAHLVPEAIVDFAAQVGA